MTPERHRQIKEIVNRAFELEADCRKAFLDRACAGDDLLRREVESWMAAEEQAAAGGFLVTPAPVKFAEVLAREQGNSMSTTVTIRVTGGPMRGQDFIFNEHDIFVFGRADDCHARLSENDITASRHHFILEINPPDARIRDLGSLNGTYVNGTKYGGRAKHETPEEAAQRKYPEVDLKDGDEICVGETAFLVRVEAPKAAEPMRCGQCGKDVSAEVGIGRRGDYACQSCQTEALSDPAAALVKELLNRAHGQVAPGPSDIGGYELGKQLGEGGMGAVYLARRKRDGAMVALKVMLAKVAVDEYSRQMFQREIEVTRGLRHPNIIELFDHGSAGSGFYFAMELCSGGSVDRLMERRGGKLSLAEAGLIILQTLEGLSFAHDGGFVHRDIKPQNILLTAERGGVAKVSDFGLAKSFQKAGLSGMTATGAAAGTPYFMPREQLTNFKYVKPVSDVWSIGATLYHMLTSEFPRNFQRGQDPMEVILRGGVVPILNRDPNIPKKVAEVIDRSLADNVKARYQTAAEFREALDKAL